MVAKLRKAAISFIMSVRPSIRPSAWNNLTPTQRIFMKFDIRVFFEILAKKFRFNENMAIITITLYVDLQYTHL